MLNGVIVETFDTTTDQSPSNNNNFYGFSNIVFDEISVTPESDQMYLDNLQTQAATAAVPFEFSPTLGLLLAGGLWGSNRLYRKHQVKKVALIK